MSDPTTPATPSEFPLRSFVFEKLKAAFGEPTRIVGTDRHWALRPGTSLLEIHILCNGKDDFPIAWVFDPHGRAETARYTVIKDMAEVGPLVEIIRQQVKHAGPRR